MSVRKRKLMWCGALECLEHRQLLSLVANDISPLQGVANISPQPLTILGAAVSGFASTTTGIVPVANFIDPNMPIRKPSSARWSAGAMVIAASGWSKEDQTSSQCWQATLTLRPALTRPPSPW